MAYKLMGANVSPYVRKVRVLLAEKAIAYDLEPVSPFAPPAGWREISPLGRIPALLDGTKVVNDSSVICQYLERKARGQNYLVNTEGAPGRSWQGAIRR